jgi:uncharacterized membrane protein
MVWLVPVGLAAWALFETLVDWPASVEWFLIGSFAIQTVEGTLLVLIGALVLRRRPGLFLGWLSYAGGLYTLVLLALRLASAPAVSAVRETSVVIAVVLARAFLREPVGARRLGGAVLVAAGVALLALS